MVVSAWAGLPISCPPALVTVPTWSSSYWPSGTGARIYTAVSPTSLVSQVSARSWDHNEFFAQFAGDHTLLTPGYSVIIEKLAEGLDIRLKSPVSINCWEALALPCLGRMWSSEHAAHAGEWGWLWCLARVWKYFCGSFIACLALSMSVRQLLLLGNRSGPSAFLLRSYSNCSQPS